MKFGETPQFIFKMSEKRRPPPPPLQLSPRRPTVATPSYISRAGSKPATSTAAAASEAAHTPHKYLALPSPTALSEWICDGRIAAETDTVDQLVKRLAEAGWTTVEGLR